MTTTANAKRLSVLASSLRVMAMLAENAKGPKDMVSIIKGLQESISLVSLCMFSWTQNIIQNAKHDIDATEDCSLIR